MRSAQEAIEKKGSFKSTRNLPNLMPVVCRAEIKKLGYSGTFANKHDKFQQLQSQLAEITGLLVIPELLENLTKFQ